MMGLEEALNILVALGRCNSVPQQCIGCPCRDIARSTCKGIPVSEIIEAGRFAEQLLPVLQCGEAAVVPPE